MTDPSRSVLIVSSGNPDAGVAGSYRRALIALGATVASFDLESHKRAILPVSRVTHRLSQHIDLPVVNMRANRALVMAAMKLQPSMIIVMTNESVRPATLVQLRISVPGVKIVNVYTDMLFTMRDSLVACLPHYDVFGFHTRRGVPILKERGCPGAFYLPLAADPGIHQPETLDAEEQRRFGCELVFAGQYRPEHAELFAALEGMDLKIWGSDRWKGAESAWVRSRYQGPPLHVPSDYAKANRGAKIALAPIDPLDLPGHNMRCFELPSCEAFSLVTRTEEVCEMFVEDESVVCFSDARELVEKVRHYLPRPEERQRIARAARERLLAGKHTYDERARTLLGAAGLSAWLR